MNRFFLFLVPQTSMEKRNNSLLTLLYGLVIKASYAETALCTVTRADKNHFSGLTSSNSELLHFTLEATNVMCSSRLKDRSPVKRCSCSVLSIA